MVLEAFEFKQKEQMKIDFHGINLERIVHFVTEALPTYNIELLNIQLQLIIRVKLIN